MQACQGKAAGRAHQNHLRSTPKTPQPDSKLGPKESGARCPSTASRPQGIGPAGGTHFVGHFVGLPQLNCHQNETWVSGAVTLHVCLPRMPLGPQARTERGASGRDETGEYSIAWP